MRVKSGHKIRDNTYAYVSLYPKRQTNTTEHKPTNLDKTVAHKTHIWLLVESDV